MEPDSQVIGYVRQINDDQLAANKDKGYKFGNNFGQSGLENTYEQYLRGQNGGATGGSGLTRQAGTGSGCKGAGTGNNLVLTIDQKVQKAAEEALVRMSPSRL